MQRVDTDPITPDELVKAWGIRPRLRVWVGGNDRDARRFVEGVLADRETVRPAQGQIDAAFVTAKDVEEALYFLDKLGVRLVDRAIVWIVMSERGGRDPESTQEMLEQFQLLCSGCWIVEAGGKPGQPRELKLAARNTKTDVAPGSSDARRVDGWTATAPVRVVGGFVCVRVDRILPG